MSGPAEIQRLAEAAIDSDLAYHSDDVTISADTFYRPVLELLAENRRLRDEVDFWDLFYDEAFPAEPFVLGVMRAEVDRLRASVGGEG